MRETISDAISELRVLRIYYEPGWRTIEPHTLGYGSSNQLLLRAYQTEGASETGEPEHWKLFRLDKMQVAEPTGEQFDGPRPGYKRGDSIMKGGIIVQL